MKDVRGTVQKQLTWPLPQEKDFYGEQEREKKIFRGIGKGPEQRERETDWTRTGLEGRIKNNERSRRGGGGEPGRRGERALWRLCDVYQVLVSRDWGSWRPALALRGGHRYISVCVRQCQNAGTLSSRVVFLLPEARKRLFLGMENLFHEFTRKAGFCVTTRNSSIVQFEFIPRPLTVWDLSETPRNG